MSLALKKMTRSPSDRSLYFYVICLAAHIGLVWLLPYVPTQDGPSHLYNLVILKDLLNGGTEWGDYFTAQLQAVPNLGFHIIAYPLLSIFPPLIVEKIFISCYAILMGVSVPLLLRTFNRPALPLAYLVFPVIFNFTLLMGFYSYAMAVPLFILAFALSWELRNRSFFLKFVCLNVAGFVLYYFHLIPFIFFLMSQVAIIMAVSVGYKGKIRELLKLSAILLPSLLNLLLYLSQGTISHFPGVSYLFSILRFMELIVDLSFFTTVNYFLWQLFPASLFMFLIVLFGHAAVKDIHKRWKQTGDIPTSEKTLVYLAAALIAIYLLAPSHFGDGAYFNQRFPWVILLVILPLLRVPDTGLFKRFGPIAIAGVVTIYFVCNAAILWNQNLKVKKFLSGLNTELPKGAFVMTYKPASVHQWPRVDVLLHAASYYGLFRGCIYIGDYETVSPYFPVRFKKTLPAFPSLYQMAYEPENIDWTIYTSVQYLLGWEVGRRDKDELQRYFINIRENGPLTVWQRKQTVL